MKNSLSRFNVRVYGIFLCNDNQLLTCHEKYGEREIIKLPGGGIKLGEGPLDALKREFKEELSSDIEILSHFYTTDFFQLSAFDPKDQIISLYYLVKVLTKQKDWITPSFIRLKKVKLNLIEPSYFTFPIDQKVAALLIENCL